MSKLSLTSIATLTNDNTATANINANSVAISAALENTLSRDGTSPNQMTASLDMNSQRILNLPAPLFATDAVRLQDLSTLNGGGTVTNIPAGGNTGDVLVKTSGANYAVGWGSDASLLSAGSNIVLSGTSPVTVATSLTPTFTTVNKVTITAPATSAALTIANGATLTASANATVSGTNTGDQTITLTGDVTGSGTGSFATAISALSVTTAALAANAVTNAKMATMAAFTFKGNNTSGTAAPTDIDIAALTTKASPAATDYVLVSDQAASGAWKKATISSVGTAGSVSSIAGNTGAFTLSNGIKNSTNDIQADPVFHRGYISGLTLSTAGSSATFSVSIGLAVDSTSAGFMSLASAYSKTTSAWALGTAAGSLDTGAIANSTWYHVYVIKRVDTGVVDVLISLSATAPTMPTNYTLFRRIGSMKTNGSAQWTKFFQDGNLFQWDVGVIDVNASTLTSVSRTLVTVSTPLGVNVIALMGFEGLGASTNSAVLLTDPAMTDTAASLTAFTLFIANTTGSRTGCPVQCRTNTSSQIGIRGAGTETFNLFTSGWMDTRGRFS